MIHPFIFSLFSDPKDTLTGQHYVSLLYNGEPLVLPACGGTMCPLELFMTILQSHLPADWAAACIVPAKEASEKPVTSKLT